MLFFFNHSLTNSYNFIRLFAPPPTPGTEPFQQFPTPGLIGLDLSPGEW